MTCPILFAGRGVAHEGTALLASGSTMTLEALAERAARLAPQTTGGEPLTSELIPGLTLLRHPRRTAFEASIYEPVFCLILEGAKETTVGDRTCRLEAGHGLVVSHELPVLSRITRAPYLSLLLDLDLPLLRSLEDEDAPPPGTATTTAFEVEPCDDALVDAIDRYLALVRSPADLRVLGPLALREIHYRILGARCGVTLRRLLRKDSHASGVARAIAHLRRNFKTSVAVPELARRAGMSPAAFHKHFKAVTSATPLQYQKDLRLVTARRLLRAGEASVTDAAFDVGYQSPSQFSREYARKFGVPPTRDRTAHAAE